VMFSSVSGESRQSRRQPYTARGDGSSRRIDSKSWLPEGRAWDYIMYMSNKELRRRGRR
jgi:hypothetical protein